MKSVLRYLRRAALFLLLTIITQIGGIAYLLSIPLRSKLPLQTKWIKPISFAAVYLVLTFLLTPLLAPLFGRVKIQHSSNIAPTNYMTVLLNRNYVKPDLNTVLQKAAANLEPQGIKVKYLDACFPFVDGFPLPPHLSHNDGKKVDISLIYEDADGTISNKKKSISGYGHFEEPTAREGNQTQVCKERGYWQYDFPKYLSFGSIRSDLQFSNKGTKQLTQAFLSQSEVSKIFIEPHLKSRMGLANQKVRFHGCRAVRHDDHIHVQIYP